MDYHWLSSACLHYENSRNFYVWKFAPSGISRLPFSRRIFC